MPLFFFLAYVIEIQICLIKKYKKTTFIKELMRLSTVTYHHS